NLLDHITDAPPEPDQIPCSSRLSLHDHLPASREQQAVHHFESRRLTRAASTQQNQNLSRAYLQIESIQNAITADRVRDVPKLNLAQAFSLCAQFAIHKVSANGNS